MQHKTLVLFWIVYMWIHHFDYQAFFALRRFYEWYGKRLDRHFNLAQWEETHGIDYRDYLRLIP